MTPPFPDLSHPVPFNPKSPNPSRCLPPFTPKSLSSSLAPQDAFGGLVAVMPS